MRERAVPCRGATLRESIAGKHFTFNDSAICDRCELAARVAASARVARGVGGNGEAPTSPFPPLSAEGSLLVPSASGEGAGR